MKSLLVIVVVLACMTSAYTDQRVVKDNYEYLISAPLKLQWNKALAYCIHRGMYLIDIPTEVEHNRVINVIKSLPVPYSTGGYWTSGNDLDAENHYYWMTTLEKFHYTNFHHNQPDNWAHSEDCIELELLNDVYKWNDRSCYDDRYAICRNETLSRSELPMKFTNLPTYQHTSQCPCIPCNALPDNEVSIFQRSAAK